MEERHIHSYSSPLNVGHKGLSPREGPRLFDDEVYIQEKVDGCVTPDTKILMADLTYRYAGDLLVGDTLIGCSESPVNTRLEQSIVEVAHPITKDCYKIATEYTNKQKKPYKFERKIYNNVEVVASHDHPWLVDGKSNNLKSWKITEDLAVGDEIVSIPCWETDDSYEA
ncbi:MAG: Hint domain-containing protein, partial [Candidatus Thorarchaeota archaeon]